MAVISTKEVVADPGLPAAVVSLRDVLSHLALIIGAAVMVFPVYMAFVASTHQLSQSLTGLPLLPGDQFLANYKQVIVAGLRNYGLPPIGPMLINSVVVALAIT